MSAENDVPRLELLGTPKVFVEGRPTRIPTKGFALLIALATNPESEWPRHKLSTWLWPSSPESNARHSLSQLVYTLRQSLGEEAISATPEYLQLGKVSCDLTDFRAAMANRDWIAATRHFKGPLALGFMFHGAADFEHWLDQEQREVAKAAALLAKELGSAMRWAEAIAIVDALELHAPPDVDLARIKVRGLVELSRHDSAEEFLAALPPDVADQAEDIVDSDLPGTALRGADFVGRSEAMSWLEARYHDALHSQAIFALVEGEPGVGKTTLIERFARLAALRGARVLTAVAYEAESNLPRGTLGPHVMSLGWCI